MDVYSIVTERVVKELEKALETGISVPWKKPWITINSGACNRFSGHRYSVLNQILLGRAGEFATRKQWTEHGFQLKEDAKPSIVVFFKWPEKPEDEEKTEEEQKEARKSPVLRYYRVYHSSQIDGEVEPLHFQEPALYDTEPEEEAERVFWDYVQREGIRVEEELSNMAYYSPSDDRIHLPSIRQYEVSAAYYDVAFHEAGHSTGAEKRLNRPGLKTTSFGSESYSQEELVAEVSSSIILNSLGIQTKGTMENNAAYISGWLKALKQKDNRKAFVYTCIQAEKAARYIMGK